MQRCDDELHIACALVADESACASLLTKYQPRRDDSSNAFDLPIDGASHIWKQK